MKKPSLDNRQWVRPTVSISSHLAAPYITSQEPGIQKLSGQFERLKNPLLSNAFGKTAALVDNGGLIVIASAVDGEGKTFTAINLALSLAADLEQEVLLIDGDLKQREITQKLQINHLPGLFDILTDNTTTLNSALAKTDIHNLNILPAGKSRRGSTEVLCSRQMDEFISQLTQYQRDSLIIIDTPSLLDTAEAQVFTEIAGQIVFVIGAETTRQRTIKKALKLLPTRTAVNLILNKSTSISHNRGN